MIEGKATTYTAAGVDTQQEEAALSRLKSRVRGTWPGPGEFGEVKLDIGYFANVIDIGGGQGLAISADGVGTKVLIAQQMHKYDTVGIDCVAMNVNDIICVGARPLSMVDYIATQRLNPDVIDDLMKGLCEGARCAGVSIPGGEIAQVRDLLQGVEDESGFDIAGAAVGMVALDKIIVGRDIVEGDVIIGIESNGIHSNGLTLARQAFTDARGKPALDSRLPGLAVTLGEELLRPTHIYVPEVLAVMGSGAHVKALIHITSDGLLNLSRVDSPTGYVIEKLPPKPAIFRLIQERGGVPETEMYSTFNMGVGFCIVAPETDAELVISIVERHGKRAQRIGYAVHDKEQRVMVEPAGLEGQGKLFRAV